jgi:hypothetical protein
VIGWVETSAANPYRETGNLCPTILGLQVPVQCHWLAPYRHMSVVQHGNQSNRQRTHFELRERLPSDAGLMQDAPSSARCEDRRLAKVDSRVATRLDRY